MHPARLSTFLAYLFLFIFSTGAPLHAASTTRILALSGDLDFGKVPAGKAKSATLTIRNKGNSPLKISKITFPAGFSGNFAGSIAAGGSRKVTVTFRPTKTSRSYKGKLTVFSNRTSGTSTYTVKGTGIATRILSLSGDFKFGGIPVGEKKTLELTLKNTGNTSLKITKISYPSGFSGGFSGTLSAGASKKITVTFKPTGQKSYSGTAKISSNKTSGKESFSLSGSGKAPLPSLSLSSKLSFGKVVIGNDKNLSVNLKNTGKTSIKVTKIVLPNGFSGSFAGTIPAGSSKKITVRFKPVTQGAYSGKLIVYSEKASGQNQFPVQGEGTTNYKLQWEYDVRNLHETMRHILDVKEDSKGFTYVLGVGGPRYWDEEDSWDAGDYDEEDYEWYYDDYEEEDDSLQYLKKRASTIHYNVVAVITKLSPAGKIVWSSAANGVMFSRLYLSQNEDLYLAGEDSDYLLLTLAKMSAKTGEVVWTEHYEGATAHFYWPGNDQFGFISTREIPSPVNPEEQFLQADSLVKIDPSTGEALSTVNLKLSPSVEAAEWKGDAIYLKNGDVILDYLHTGTIGNLVAINSTTGEARWTKSYTKSTLAEVLELSKDDTLIALESSPTKDEANVDSVFVKYDPLTGNAIWKTATIRVPVTKHKTSLAYRNLYIDENGDFYGKDILSQTQYTKYSGKSGFPLWSKPIKKWPDLWINAKTFAYAEYDGLYAHDTTTSNLIWVWNSSELQDWTLYFPSTASENLYKTYAEDEHQNIVEKHRLITP